MPQQLPYIAILELGDVDLWKAIAQQKLQNVQSVARVGLLLAHHGSANLCRVSHPQFVLLLLQHAFKPASVARGFDPDPRRRGQGAVKLSSFPALMFQPSLHDLPGFCIQHRDLLESRMKIAAYNIHNSAPSLRALVLHRNPSLLARRSRRRYSITLAWENQAQQFYGPAEKTRHDATQARLRHGYATGLVSRVLPRRRRPRMR